MPIRAKRAPSRRPRSRASKARPIVDYKAIFEQQMIARGIPEAVKEFPFEPGRGAAGFRWDWAWPMHGLKIAVEYDGGIYQRHASHSSATHQQRDRDKGNLAVVLGWKVLRITHKNVQDASAVEQLAFLMLMVDARERTLYRDAWLPIYRGSETRLRPARPPVASRVYSPKVPPTRRAPARV